MTSGQWITYFIPACLVIFTIWEFVQLARRRAGNKSALTMSQYVVRRAKAGSKFWKRFLWMFPTFLLVVQIVLLFHWQAFCINWGYFCEIDF